MLQTASAAFVFGGNDSANMVISAALKDHFRDVVEWCVQYKINPGFADKKHELYRMAWQKLDDEVGGLAQSKFLSSSWKRDFVMALRARPEMVYTEERDRALVPKDCEACGRSGHPAG